MLSFSSFFSPSAFLCRRRGEIVEGWKINSGGFRAAVGGGGERAVKNYQNYCWQWSRARRQRRSAGALVSVLCVGVEALFSQQKDLLVAVGSQKKKKKTLGDWADVRRTMVCASGCQSVRRTSRCALGATCKKKGNNCGLRLLLKLNEPHNGAGGCFGRRERHRGKSHSITPLTTNIICSCFERCKFPRLFFCPRLG